MCLPLLFSIMFTIMHTVYNVLLIKIIRKILTYYSWYSPTNIYMLSIPKFLLSFSFSLNNDRKLKKPVECIYGGLL